MSVRLEIPMLPPPELNPNAREFWVERHKAARDFRKAAWAIAYNTNPAHEVMFPKAVIKVTLVYKNHQVKPDPDNAVTMLKSALDGIVDAKILENDTRDHVRYIQPFSYEVDPQRAPLTIMEVESDGCEEY